MPSRILISFLAFLLIVGGCSEKKTTTPDGNGGDDPGGDDYTLEEEATIGAQGGTLETDDFALTVRPGAFDTAYPLALFSSTTDRPYGDDAITRTFRLEGLPDSWADTLDLSLAYQGQQTPPLHIAVGEPVENLDTGETDLVYDLIPSVALDGRLLASLPPINRSERSPSSPLKASISTATGGLRLFGLSGWDIYDEEDPYFLIAYPTAFDANMDDLAGFLYDGLETCVNVFDMGFSHRSWQWPITIVVSPEEKMGGSHQLHYVPKRGERTPKFRINAADFATYDLSLARIVAKDVILTVAILTYDSPPLYSWDSHIWWHAACKSWAEEYYPESQGDFKRPLLFENNSLAPFHGLYAGIVAPSGPRQHGIGVSSVIKSLMDAGYLSPSDLGTIYESIRTLVSPIDAFMEKVGSSATDWWPAFFEHYVAGEIYDIDSTAFLANASDAWTIDGPEDTQTLFSSYDADIERYPDLSAQMFGIGLTYSGFGPNDALRFTVSSDQLSTHYLTTLVFGLEGGSLVYYGKGDDFRLAGLRGLVDAGVNGLLAVVVNSFGAPPYTGTSDVDLEVKLEEAGPPDMPHVDVEIAFIGHWHWRDADMVDHYFDEPVSFSVAIQDTFPYDTIIGRADHPENPCQPAFDEMGAFFDLQGPDGFYGYVHRRQGEDSDDCFDYKFISFLRLPQVEDLVFRAEGANLGEHFRQSPPDLRYRNEEGYLVRLESMSFDESSRISVVITEP